MGNFKFAIKKTLFCCDDFTAANLKSYIFKFLPNMLFNIFTHQPLRIKKYVILKISYLLGQAGSEVSERGQKPVRRLD